MILCSIQNARIKGDIHSLEREIKITELAPELRFHEEFE